MKRLSLIWLLLPAIALLAAFIVMPTFDLIRASIFDPEFTLEHFQRLVERGVYVDVMWRTVRVSLIVAVICTIVGYPVAMFINLQPKKRQVALLFLILIPMWMSVLIRTFAWIVVLGREGLINDLMIGLGLTGAPVQMLYTSGTVITAMVQMHAIQTSGNTIRNVTADHLPVPPPTRLPTRAPWPNWCASGPPITQNSSRCRASSRWP